MNKSLQMHFLMEAGDSLTDVLRVVSVLWLYELGCYIFGCLMQLDFTPKQTSHNQCLSSLSATKVTTLWLKQPNCFCSVLSSHSFIIFFTSSGPIPASIGLISHPTPHLKSSMRNSELLLKKATHLGLSELRVST